MLHTEAIFFFFLLKRPGCIIEQVLYISHKRGHKDNKNTLLSLETQPVLKLFPPPGDKQHGLRRAQQNADPQYNTRACGHISILEEDG